MTFERILMVGCGNMAGAMLTGWLAGGIPASRFTVCDPAPRVLPTAVTVSAQMPARGPFDAILVGVKPQSLAEVAPALEPLAGPGATVLSILAGVELATLAGKFPRAGSLVRMMPNLAVAIGKAPVGLAATGLGAEQRSALEALVGPLGSPEWLAEAQFDLFTALAGSGPAFLYRLIAALAEGACRLGMDAGQAERIAIAMVEGAAALAAASPDSPGVLADQVASPGGTTRAGLAVLDADNKLARLVEATLRAARDRSAQMTQEARG